MAVLLMLCYEGYWIRYFRSEQKMTDFYSDFLGIPVAGASLPVAAFFFLGIYGANFFLLLATVILGICLIKRKFLMTRKRKGFFHEFFA
jgi:hypothetical protein